MLVQVRDNNVDQALKALKKKMQREGIFREMKLRNYYEKPSEKRVREQAEAVRRARKLARKRLQREGLLPGKTLVKPGARPGPGGRPGGPSRGGSGGPRAPAASVAASAGRGSTSLTGASHSRVFPSPEGRGRVVRMATWQPEISAGNQRLSPRIQSRIASSAPLPLR